MKYTIVVKYKDNDMVPAWRERCNDAHLKTKVAVVTSVLDMVAGFNRQRAAQYGAGNYDARELVTIDFDDPDNNEKELGFEHDWKKTNLTTVSGGRGGGMYDTYRCSWCGATGKRRSLEMIIDRDTKFRAAKYEYCPESPELEK